MPRRRTNSISATVLFPARPENRERGTVNALDREIGWSTEVKRPLSKSSLQNSRRGRNSENGRSNTLYCQEYLLLFRFVTPGAFLLMNPSPSNPLPGPIRYHMVKSPSGGPTIRAVNGNPMPAGLPFKPLWLNS
ncbi:unnamed protein product [Tuber aestivum]|uniref:Uncharacterized protein n=1 Tax=Tuber aestivum TaxID=59557 RepID=A0A292Q548_9PEZI|nr:unnamed protein product [Tuber aestivum]